MENKLSKEAYRQLARERGLLKDQPSTMPSFPELLKSSAAGIIKGLEQTGANILSTPGALLNQFAGTQFEPVQVPESIDPTKQWQLSQHPFALAAQKIPEVLSPFTYGFGLQHYTGAKLSPTIGLPTRAVTAGGIGYATSPGMEKEKTLTALSEASLPVIGGLTQAGIGKKVTALSKQRHQIYTQKYNQLLNRVENLPGKKEMRVPSSLQSEEVNIFMQGLEPKYKQSLRRFIDNPTFRNAHDAQSDINKGIRSIQNKSSSGKELTQQERYAASKAKDYQKRIQGEMMRFLTEKGAPEIAESYGGLTRGYAKDVAPLKFKEAEVARKEKEKITKSKVGRAALQKEEQFERSGLAEQIPGYRMRQRLEPAMPLIKRAGGSAAVLGAVGAAAPFIPSYIYQLLNSTYGK